MRYRYIYKYKTGLTKVKTRLALAFTVLALGAGGIVGSIAIFGSAHALPTPDIYVSNSTIGGGSCASPDYNTIQGAVNGAVPGDVIFVCDGSYTENVVVDTANLTIEGNQAGVDARTRSGTESVLAGSITINANNVTVDGFTVNNAAATSAFAMLSGNSGEIIKNNIINNSGSAVSFDTSNTILSQNAVMSTATATEGFQASTIPLSKLTVSDNNFSGANSAIYNADVTVIEGNSNVVISGNSSTGDGTLIALFKTNGAQITNNTVVGATKSTAVYIGGSDGNITVNGNQISSAASAVKVTVYPDAGLGPNADVTVTNNTLSNNQYGMYVVASSETGTVVANRNSITGNVLYGIYNDPASGVSTLNGTCNWWGAANGPKPTGSGDLVSSNVTFQPWLVSSDLNGPCIGGNVATTKDQCKDGVWQTMTDSAGRQFKNQGDCVSYVATNGKNPASGPAKH